MRCALMSVRVNSQLPYMWQCACVCALVKTSTRMYLNNIFALLISWLAADTQSYKDRYVYVCARVALTVNGGG